MNIQNLLSSELAELIKDSSTPEETVQEAIQELDLRDHTRIYEEEIADMIIYFKNL